MYQFFNEENTEEEKNSQVKLNQANVMIGGPSAFGFGSGCLWWKREAAAEFRVLFNPAVSWTRKPTPPPTNA